MTDNPKTPADSVKASEDNSNNGRYILKLFISGNTARSGNAIINIKRICEEKLKGKYVLEIIDLYQKPELAKEANLIAAPTLIKMLPLPLRRIIGDMSDVDSVLKGLDLRKINDAEG